MVGRVRVKSVGKNGRMMVSDQPVIGMLDQNHAKSSPRFLHSAVSNRAEFIEPSRVGDVVVEHHDRATRRGNAGPKHLPMGWTAPQIAMGCIPAGLMIQPQTKKRAARLPVSLASITLLPDGKPSIISIVDVEIALEVLGRLLVGAIFHHVELTVLVVDHRTGLDLTSALLHGSFVLRGTHLDIGFVNALGMNVDRLAFPHGSGLRRLLCLRDGCGGQADHQTGTRRQQSPLRNRHGILLIFSRCGAGGGRVSGSVRPCSRVAQLRADRNGPTRQN
jgi:hypothetical protein